MRRQPHIDELGRDERGVKHDDAKGPRAELRIVTADAEPNTYGVPASTVASIIEAIEREDAEDENELLQRRDEMERVLTANWKDKLLREMSDLLTRIHEVLGQPMPHNTSGSALFAARLIANHPGIGLDQAVFMTARHYTTGKFGTFTHDEVKAFKP